MAVRLALLLIALLALSAEARADVFVPADPPVLRSAACVAGAGDVVAAGAAAGPLRVSVGGGGWHALGGMLGCPVVAGAADGTTAVAGYGPGAHDPTADGMSLAVRRPGEDFGTPIGLGDSGSEAPAVAAAPGGWVVVVWDAGDAGLIALVVRPDGTAVRTVLDPPADATFFSRPQAGIDAGGNTTVAWQRFDRRAGRLRVARGVAGAPPAPVADLPGAHETVRGLSLAVAASGRSLIAWASDDGVRAMLDDRAPQVLGRAAQAEPALAAGIADDGTALLAWLGTGNEVVAAEWAGAAWLAPRVLAPGHAEQYHSFAGEDDPSDDVVLASVAPGGRGTVAWSAPRNGDRSVHAVTGAVGGTWSSAARLSSVTRVAWSPALGVDAAGVPRVLWSEAGLGARGAAVAPARLDAAAPAVAARLPSRIPPTLDGAIAVTARVRCSEACDARLAFAGGEHDRGSTVVALDAGRTGTLRLRASDEFEYELIVSRRARRLRVQLLVTDRAGNLVRRSAMLRVRVLEPPIRTLKVALGHRFGMETPAGDRAVARLVNDMIETIARGHVSSRALARRFARGFAAVARRFGPDATYSDEVQSAIYDALWVPLARTHHDVGSVLQG